MLNKLLILLLILVLFSSIVYAPCDYGDDYYGKGFYGKCEPKEEERFPRVAITFTGGLIAAIAAGLIIRMMRARRRRGRE